MTDVGLPIALALAAAPALLLAWLLIRADRHEPEGVRPLLICLALGGALPLLARSLEDNWLLEGFYTDNFFSFVLGVLFVAVIEEGLKFLTFLAYPYRQAFFNEPMDGIVYAGMIGMGFALVENAWFAWHYGWTTVLLRGLTAVPAHAIFAVMLGYYAGRARFHPEEGRRRLLTLGWLWAVGLHAGYNFLLLQRAYDWLLLLAAPLLGLSAWMAIDLIRRSEEDSPFR